MFKRTTPIKTDSSTEEPKIVFKRRIPALKEAEQPEGQKPINIPRKKKFPKKHPSRGYGGMMPFPPKNCLGHIRTNSEGKKFVDLPTCLNCKWNPCERRQEFSQELKDWHQLQIEKRENRKAKNED